MATFEIDTAEVAATPAHDCGVWTVSVPAGRADAYAAALWALGFRGVKVTDAI